LELSCLHDFHFIASSYWKAEYSKDDYYYRTFTVPAYSP
jgi:hypothetical protein